MTIPLLLALFWFAFAGGHLVLSSAPVRPGLRARLGAQAFKGLYALVALGTFVPLVWIFATHRHAGPVLWPTLGPPALARRLAYVLMAVAMVLLVAAVLPGSAAPSSMGARDAVQARGMTRITRHPLFMALALFGIAHLLVNGRLGDVVFFAGFPLFAWVGARHQDARLARERTGYASFVAETSLVPFAAIAAGRQKLVVSELPSAAIVAGLVLTVVLRYWHGALFGP